MPTFFNYPDLRERLIVLEGWSKAYSMTGWRLGWSFWPKDLVQHVNKLLINSVSCVNAAAQFAGIAALDGPDDSIHLMMEKFTQRRKLIHEGLKKHPHVTILSDEIYSRQIFDDKEMPTFFNYPDLRDRLIVLSLIHI